MDTHHQSKRPNNAQTTRFLDSVRARQENVDICAGAATAGAVPSCALLRLAMLSYPRTPSRRAPHAFSPFYDVPAYVPNESPTPAPCTPLLDRFPAANDPCPATRALSAADTLLHLASSPAKSSPSLRPSRSSFGSAPYGLSRTHSHSHSHFNSHSHGSYSHGGHSQSTQSTFLQSPLPVTPSRALYTPKKRAAKLDALDISTHLFSSPARVFASPRHHLDMFSDTYPTMSPVFHHGETPAPIPMRTLPPMPRFMPEAEASSRRMRHFKIPTGPSFDELLNTPCSMSDFDDSSRRCSSEADFEHSSRRCSSVVDETTIAVTSSPVPMANSSPVSYPLSQETEPTSHYVSFTGTPAST